MEWAGGRNASIQGPTIDFQSFFSGRGVATNFIGAPGEPLFDDAAFIASFGLQFDHPAGYAGQAPFAGAAPTPATGWTGAAAQATARPRRCACGCSTSASTSTASTPTSSTARTTAARTTTRCCSRATKDAADAVGPSRKGQWADVKVTIIGGALDGKTAGMLVKVEELTKDLSRVRLFHTSVSRAIASWPSWPGEPGFTGEFDEYLAQKFPTSTAADFADPRVRHHQRGDLRRAGPLLGDRPPADARVHRRRRTSPDLLLVGVPTTDEFQHQFLGLVTHEAPERCRNPAYDDVDVNGSPDGRVASARGFIRTAYEGADDADAGPQLLGRTRRRSCPPITASPRSSSPSTPACRWSTSACCRSRRRRTAVRRRARRSARPRPAGPAAPADLPQPRGARPGRRRAPAGRSGRRGGDGRRDQGGVPRPDATPTTGPTTASPRAGR